MIPNNCKNFKRITQLCFSIILFASFNSICAFGNDLKGIYVSNIPNANIINGQVVNTDGDPLMGVSITVKGTKTGTSTDIKGNYSIPAPVGSILVFSYVGFVSQEIIVKGKKEINVRLEADTKGLGEVVVVAFGTKKKTDMVGSVTSVNPSELKVPSSNLTTALAGRIAGMISYQRSGEPGQDNASFFIRGVTYFGTGKVDPLIMIDGVELSVDAMARLRPDDIESFSVLKDATATAVYGSRAANGVILIKTKEGKEGKARISLRAENSISSPTSNVEFADPVTYMQMYNEALVARDPFAEPYYSPAKIDGTKEKLNPYIFPATDWREHLFKKSTVNQRYNLNVSGGGKVARYYVAGSLSQDNGILKVDKRNNFNNNINLKSYTLRANVNVNVTKTTELTVRLNGNFDDYVGPIDGGTTLYNKVVHTSPVDFPAYYPVDSAHELIRHILFGGISDKSFDNPYADMVRGYKSYSSSLMMAQLEAKQDFSFITKGLSLRMMMNTNRTSRFDVVRAYSPFYYTLNYFDPKTLDYQLYALNENTGTEYLTYDIPDLSRIQNSAFYFESVLNYDRTFNDKHKVGGLLVYTQRSELDAAGNSLLLSLPHRNVGLSGRFAYSYDERYFAEFNFGYNGSERFYKDKRFGFFPSMGVAWTISNEKFWKPAKDIVTDFRIRATYGLVGNDQIGSPSDRFYYLSNVNMSDGALAFQFGKDFANRKNGVSISRYSNEDITWETAQQGNLGLELGFFNGLNIKADFYTQLRKNILMDRTAIPTFMGLSAPIRANVGEASSKGMDISINYNHSFYNGMWLQIMGNFTYATSKYKVYEEPDYGDNPWLSHVGLSLSQPLGFLAERLFVDDNDVANSPLQQFGSQVIGGDVKYKDINKDGQITDLDKIPIGYPTTPEIVYGFGFSFGYKNFDISSFFQGLSHESFWINPGDVNPFNNNTQLIKAFADDHYSPQDPNIYALFPRFSTGDNSNNMQLSSWWLRNGAFLRLKQAEIGYTLPSNVANKLHMEKLRVYVNGSNLFLLSYFKLWDIEMGGNGLGYPVQRVYNMGISLNF